MCKKMAEDVRLAEFLFVKIKNFTGVIGSVFRHLELDAALGRVEHRTEPGLVLVGNHARDARVFELGLCELGIPCAVVAGDGDEGPRGVVCHSGWRSVMSGTV